VNCTEIIGDRPGQQTNKISAKSVGFNRLSFDLLGLRSPLYGGLEFGYPFGTRHYACNVGLQMATPTLSCVMLALLKLLVNLHAVLTQAFRCLDICFAFSFLLLFAERNSLFSFTHTCITLHASSAKCA